MTFKPRFLFSVLCIVAGVASTPGHLLAASPDRDSKIKAWLGSRPGGVVVAWVDAGGVSFSSAGQFSKTDARPVTPDTQFEIGSVTKVFTALLLVESVRAGKVTLDAPVGPPFTPSKVTYLQLATHTSGLPAWPEGFTPSDESNPVADQDLKRLVTDFNAAAARSKESSPQYSNFGFAVLGQALAGVWGEPYETVLTRRVLLPLGMNDTVIDWHLADRQRLAPGHDNNGKPSPNWDFNNAYPPAGALVSTARDLVRLVQACLGNADTPLNPALQDMVIPRVRVVPPSGLLGLFAPKRPERQLGLAWVTEKHGEASFVVHGGNTGAYAAFVAFDQAHKRGLVILTNHRSEPASLAYDLLK